MRETPMQRLVEQSLAGLGNDETLAQAIGYAPISFSSFSDFDADEALAYSRGLFPVLPGDKILVGGAWATVVGPSETSDRVSAGGVRIRASETLSVKHFGAVGDWDGTTGTDDTAAIDDALDWLASAAYRTLTFDEGWYYHSGGKSVDFGGRYGQNIEMKGAIYFAHTSGVGIALHNHRAAYFELELRNGGLLGDFDNLIPATGSIAFQIHRSDQVEINLRGYNYRGRMLWLTEQDPDDADTARNIRAKVKIDYGNRALLGDDARCGQPLCWDTGDVSNIGGAGDLTIDGSACDYGMFLSDLNDVTLHKVEMGPFIQMGNKFLGVSKAYFGRYWCGESDVTNSLPILVAGTSARGTKCGAWTFSSLEGLRSAAEGFHFSDFDDAKTGGLVIYRLEATTTEVALTLHNMPSVRILSAVGKDIDRLCDITGTCGRVEIHVDKIENCAQEVIKKTGSCSDEFVLSGRIEGGATGYSLVSLGTSNDLVDLKDLHLESDDADELINIGVVGPNKIRQIGGSMSGTSDQYNGFARPEVIAYVRGKQTKANGTGTILNGTDSITITHGIDITPSHVSITAGHAEVTQAVVTGKTATQFVVTVPANVTADRDFTWAIDQELLANDLDA